MKTTPSIKGHEEDMTLYRKSHIHDFSCRKGSNLGVTELEVFLLYWLFLHEPDVRIASKERTFRADGVAEN